MLVVYASRTGNIERFIKRSNLRNVIQITDGNEVIKEPFVLVTYTDRFGEVPLEISNLLVRGDNAMLLKAVAGSGNKNFGNTFCRAAKIISELFNIPLMMEFELSGRDIDIYNFVNKINNFKI